MLARFFTLLIASLWLGILAQAAEIQWVIMDSDDTDGMIFSGKIIEGDLQKLSQTISMNHWKKGLIIGFNSEGRDMFEAVKIGRYIRHNGFGTIVFDGAHCYSSCFFSFIGGAYRRVFDGKLGVHQFYGGEENATDVQSVTQYLTAELMEYTSSLWVSVETITIAGSNLAARYVYL